MGILGVDTRNSSSTALVAGDTYTGSWAPSLNSSAVMIAVKTDQAGTLYIDFSPDQTNSDSILSFSVTASVNEVHRIAVTRAYYRVRFTNTSASPQTYMRLQTLVGDGLMLTSARNSAVQQDADAQVVRAVDSEIDIANGLYTGYSIINKYGYNPDVDTGTLPEDVWDYGGLYTGFPSAAETLQVFSASANDTAAGTGARTVTINGLDANYASLSETVTLNGVTPVTTTNAFLRVNNLQVITAGSGGSNAGLITCRQSVTQTNVMCAITLGWNFSKSTAYTVPAGYSGYIRQFTCGIEDPANGYCDGYIATCPQGGIFSARRPFVVTSGYRIADTIYGGLPLPEKTDVIVRITSIGSNNTKVVSGYDVLLIKN